jgi:nitrogenase molybdenum-iron protein alpha/beta subunit
MSKNVKQRKISFESALINLCKQYEDEWDCPYSIVSEHLRKNFITLNETLLFLKNNTSFFNLPVSTVIEDKHIKRYQRGYQAAWKGGKCLGDTEEYKKGYEDATQESFYF